MPQRRSVAVFIGSLREKSLNRMTARAMAEMAPTLDFEEIEIGDLPYYNEDIEKTPPPEWVRMRDAVRGKDALLFVTPEYNRAMPAALKNAIDVASRPYGRGVFANKPAAVVTVSPGPIGGYGANHNVRQAVSGLGVAVMPAPEAYYGGASDYFDDAGALVKDDTRKVMRKFMDAYVAWIERFAG